ncbi:MAG: hypothetical protein CMN30_28780 [Sandaracinus sp.]|nr:hypothetical protein [Sandaracinus sp.]|tara:strand:- start:1139 stop:1333 length:195 start_codon:yes stop_codon:yes gene_type:complete
MPGRPERRTRFVMLDGELFHVLYRHRGVLVAERLEGEQRSEVLADLDDAQFDVSSRVRGCADDE